MRTRHGLSALAMAAGPLILSVVTSAVASGPADHDSVQDVIFLGETRPMFLRLRLSAGEKGFRAAWLDFVRALHDDLDRDHNGTLTSSEVERGSLPALVRAMTGGGALPPRLELDNNPKNGVVSVEELADAIRSSLGPFGVKVGHITNQRTDALFGQLDHNRDGSITPDELGSATGMLAGLDLDEDELIDTAELEPFSNPMTSGVEDESVRRAQIAAAPPVVELTRDDPSFRPVRLLLKKYDKATKNGSKTGDNLLTRAELGIDPETFSAADTDKDGALDTEELRRFLARVEPEIELQVRLSNESAGTATIEAVGPGGKPLPAKVKVERLSASDIEIALDEIHLEFHIEDGDRSAAEAKQFLGGQFSAADTDANNYLDKSEVMKGHTTLAALFELIDGDGDGKVYRKDLDQFVDRQAVGAHNRMSMSSADQGRAIFAILDLNRDRKLGVREIRGALARVMSWDLNHDGRIGPDEIPHHYQFAIGRGQVSLPGVQYSRRQEDIAPAAPAESKPAGPNWFVRMDHNHDGDVSRLEFFGPASAFARIDRDGDGLIDVTEAAAVGK